MKATAIAYKPMQVKNLAIDLLMKQAVTMTVNKINNDFSFFSRQPIIVVN